MVTFTSSATVRCPFECPPLLDFVAVVSVGGQHAICCLPPYCICISIMVTNYVRHSETRLNVITIQSENVSIF